MKVSEYFSDDGQRTSIIYTREGGFRVYMNDVYFETEREVYCNTLAQAAIEAENYVLRRE